MNTNLDIRQIKNKIDKLFFYNNWSDEKILKKHEYHEKLRELFELALEDFGEPGTLRDVLGLEYSVTIKNFLSKTLICLHPRYKIFNRTEKYKGKIWRRITVRDIAAVIGCSWITVQKHLKLLEDNGYTIKTQIQHQINKDLKAEGKKTKRPDNGSYIRLTEKGFTALEKAWAINHPHDWKNGHENTNKKNKLYEKEEEKILKDNLYNKSSEDNFSYRNHNSSLCANLMRIYTEFTGDISVRACNKAYAFIHKVSNWISTTSRLDLKLSRFRDYMDYSVRILGKTCSFWKRFSKKCVEGYLNVKDKSVNVSSKYSYATQEDINNIARNCKNTFVGDVELQKFYDSPTITPSKQPKPKPIKTESDLEKRKKEMIARFYKCNK